MKMLRNLKMLTKQKDKRVDGQIYPDCIKQKKYKNRTYCTRPLINRHTANVRIRFSLFRTRVHAILNVAEETQYR